jgi:hypothetical protein
MLSSHLRLGLPSGLFPPDFPTRTLYTLSPPSYALHDLPISFFSILSPAIMMPIFLYLFETLLSRVKEEHGLRAFENRILRKILG